MAIRSLIFIATLTFASASFSEDAAPPAEISEGEREYLEKVQKLTSLEAKVAEAEKQFSALVATKNKTKNKADALALIEQMKVIRTERDADVAKFNELRDEIQFKYPDRGRAIQQRFAPMQKKTMEQMEQASTLDSDLTKAKKSADRVYRPFMKEEEAVKRDSVQKAVEQKTEKTRIRLEK